MKIEITKQVSVIETIEIELPYYYKYNLGSDYGTVVSYGKIEEKRCTSIEEIQCNNEEKYEIEKEEYESIKNSGFACYFEQKYTSTKEEYEAVKQRCLLFLSNF